FTPTYTPTVTPTFTPTSTASVTPTNTPTSTPTFEIHAWPNPYNPKYAFNQSFKISCLPTGADVRFFTLSGELVDRVSETGGEAQWFGKNQSNMPVAPGVYFYVIESGSQVLKKGKLLVVR
ncbi:MAG TPA: T9SS type A sorting domain-containing protein, partial [bacterium]|nr:T9SS type A sorting domain-containing protein [bacterium]